MSWNPQFDQEKILYIATAVGIVVLLITYLVFRH